MTTRLSNAPRPDELLLTARESLKVVLREPGGDHAYTILMAMNAMGIAARAMQAAAAPPAHASMSDEALKQWLREAPAAALTDAALVDGLRRHVQGKLAVSNPRFRPEASKVES